MKIKIKGYLTFRDTIGEQFLEFVDMDRITVRDLLVKLSLVCNLGDSVYHATTRIVDPGVAVLVNGRHYSHLPDNLDTTLKDGDEVAIFPPMAGG